MRAEVGLSALDLLGISIFSVMTPRFGSSPFLASEHSPFYSECSLLAPVYCFNTCRRVESTLQSLGVIGYLGFRPVFRLRIVLGISGHNRTRLQGLASICAHSSLSPVPFVTCTFVVTPINVFVSYSPTWPHFIIDSGT